MTVKEGLHKTKDGLPKEAFAIVGDPEDTDTWRLPHHKRSIFRALKGELDIVKRLLTGIGCQLLWLPSLQVVTAGKGWKLPPGRY